MARQEAIDERTKVVELSRKEAADLIALLAGLLANAAVAGNQRGAVPEIKIVDRGVVELRLLIGLEPDGS